MIMFLHTLNDHLGFWDVNGGVKVKTCEGEKAARSGSVDFFGGHSLVKERPGLRRDSERF